MKKLLLAHVLIIFTFAVTVSTAQIITTIAGDGNAGYVGDNGPATSAQIAGAGDVTVDSNGNVYFLQAANNVIRRIDALTGVITTVAGNGTAGFTGDGGPAISASLNFSPYGGLGIDAGDNLYIADANNNRVRKVDISGKITTVAYLTNGPGDVVVDQAGNIYATSYLEVLKIDGVTGTITSVAGSNGVTGSNLTIDNNNLYMADNGNYLVHKIDLTSGIMTTVAGGGSSLQDGVPATTANINPWSVSAGNNGIYITNTYTINKVDFSTGNLNRTIGSMSGPGFGGDGGLALSALLNYNLRGLAVDNGGNIILSDGGNNRIRKVWACFSSITQPSIYGQYVCQNASATTLTVGATGIGSFSYQWYSNTTSSNVGGTLISGASGSSFTPPTNTVGTLYYYAKISGTCGVLTTAVSGPIGIDNNVVSITGQPSTTPQSVCLAGSGVQPTPLSVTVTGSPFSYAWYRNTTNTNSGGILFGTGQTFTPDTYQAGTYYYYVIVSGCNSVTSTTSGPITVNPATAISSQPSTSGQVLCQNATSTALTAAATGISLTYQWYGNATNNNSGGTMVSSATATSYTPSTSVSSSLHYYVVASGTCGNAASNPSGAILVNLATNFTIQPSSASQIVCQNGTTTDLSVAAMGTNTVFYQWYSNTSATNTGGTVISGALISSYTPPSNSVGTNYYYVIASSSCGSTTSAVSGAVQINASTVINLQPNGATQSICNNGTVTQLSVGASGTSLSYQWYSNTTANSGGVAISGATGAIYTPSSASIGTQYYYVVVTGSCGVLTSTVSGAITINPLTVITSQSSGGQTTCQTWGLSPITLTATGTGTLTYQWYSNSWQGNTGGSVISGAAGANYTPSSSNAGTNYYYATVTGACGTVSSSPSGAIQINPSTVIVSQPSGSSQLACYNGGVTPLSVGATGTALSYQWYGTNGGGAPIGGAVGSSYMPSTATIGTQSYYVVVSGSCGTVTSSISGPVTTDPYTAISSQPYSGGQTVCQYGSISSISLIASGGGSLSYQWYSGGTAISGATELNYTPSSYYPGTNYFYATVTGRCGTVSSSSSGAITVYAQTGITTQPISSQTTCPGQGVSTLTVSANGTSLSYQWYSNYFAGNYGGSQISGATGPSYSPDVTYSGFQYYYAIVYGICGSATSDVSTIHVGPSNGIIEQNYGLANYGFARLTAGPGTNYSWSIGQGGRTIDVYASGDYTVSYLTSEGCWVSAESYVEGCNGCEPNRISSDNPTKPTATTADQSHHTFGISPNPAKDEVLVVLSEVAKEDSPVTILDINGKALQSGIIEKGLKEKIFHVNDLISGMYILIIKDSRQERYRKLVIAK